MSFGEWLREQRHKNNITMAGLAARVGVSAAYIGQLENGIQRAPSRPVVESIGRALGVPLGVAYLAAGYAPPRQDEHSELAIKLLHLFEELPEDLQLVLIDIVESLYQNASRRFEGGQKRSVRRVTGTTRKKRRPMKAAKG